MKLLTRDQFREAVFSRDHHCCVFCGKPAADAHHIMERRLFSDGGYYLDNGISVCPEHHLECERTDISVEFCLSAVQLKKRVNPPQLEEDQEYDKWGNPILPNGTRLRGELFFDESVQKIIADKLYLFTTLVKYPRTYHLPWSEGLSDDDKVIENLDELEGHDVVVTVKMDGESTTMYHDNIHARSVDSRNHPSRNWVKNFHASISHDVPEGWRICGENLYAKHSIKYTDLESYFYGFSVWNEKNRCLSWDDSVEWLNLLGINQVPVIYRGIFDKALILKAFEPLSSSHEGYVVRRSDAFNYGEFRRKVGKFVRKNHVQTTAHWMQGNTEPNMLK